MVSCSHQTLTNPPAKGATVLIRCIHSILFHILFLLLFLKLALVNYLLYATDTDRNGSVFAPCFVSASDLKWADAKIENKARKN